MTACESLLFVSSPATPRERTPPAEEAQPIEVWGRMLLEDEPRLFPEVNSLERWLDLNA